MEDKLVEVFRVAKPEDKRFVTRDAAEYMKPKWQRVDAAAEQGAIKKNAAPAEDNFTDNPALLKLREQYQIKAGKEADPDWSHARIHIELVKLESQTINEVKVPEPDKTITEKVIPAPVLETPEYAKSEPVEVKKTRGRKKKEQTETPA